MPPNPPIGPEDYYDYFPTSSNGPGDVWADLPTFGILREEFLPGIVVTPACDLTNHKVETITYVPVLPVVKFQVSHSALQEVKKATDGQLITCGLAGLISLPGGFELPRALDLSAAQALIRERLEQGGSAKELDAAERALNGVGLMLRLIGTPSTDAGPSSLRRLLGDKAHAEYLGKIVKNGRADTHFLPADGQRRDWSGVPEHSAALFRYPITVPIEILNRAQTTSEADWPAAVGQLRLAFPCAHAFRVRPMKRVRVQHRFLSDLIVRFTSMFGRLGSPDFTPATVNRVVAEIQEAE